MSLKKVGKNVKIFDTAKIVYPENVEIGDNVIIDDFVLIIAKKKVVIGNNVHIASFTNITGNEEFVMEDFSGISSGVRIFTSSDDYASSCMTNPTVPDEFKEVYHKPIIFKKHSIVGANTVILPGSIIGEGTSVGANSLVSGILEDYCLYAGTPLKKIKNKNKDKLQTLEKLYYEKYGRNQG